jgi:hypothetical protein
MKAKKEFILLGIVIIAVSLYLLFRTTDKTHYQLPNIPKIAEKEITKIEISKPDTSIVLDKEDNKWLIAPKGYPADTGKVKAMLDVISGLTLTALVSEAKNYHLFDLTDDKKIRIKAWAGDSLKREFEMGRTAPSWHHTFVKLAGDTRVYHADGNFKDKFDLTMEKLRDMVVLSFDQNEIQGIEITKGKQSISPARKEIPVETSAQETNKEKAPPAPAKKETTWESSAGDKADESAVNTVLSALSNLSCEKYIEDKEKNNYTAPIYTVKIKGTKEFILSIFQKTDGDAKAYPAISSENDYPFLLSDYQAERIMKDPGELLKKKDEKSPPTQDKIP